MKSAAPVGAGAGNGPEGRFVAFESLPSPDPRDENNRTPDNQLDRAPIRPHEALALSRSPDADAVGPETIEPPPSRPRPTEIESRQEDGRRAEWGAIVFASAERASEFRVVVLDDGGQRRVVARSPSFRAPRSGRISHCGSAKEAHDLLFVQLLASGWRPVASRGRWHDVAFTRPAHSGDRPVEGLLIICDDGNLTARFQAARFDELGNATVVAESAPFRAVQSPRVDEAGTRI